MISVSMERSIRIREYEMLKKTVSFTEEDFPGLSDYPTDAKRKFLHYKAYEDVVCFEVFHNIKSAEDARNEIRRAIEFWGVNDMRKALKQFEQDDLNPDRDHNN